MPRPLLPHSLPPTNTISVPALLAPSPTLSCSLSLSLALVRARSRALAFARSRARALFLRSVRTPPREGGAGPRGPRSPESARPPPGGAAPPWWPPGPPCAPCRRRAAPRRPARGVHMHEARTYACGAMRLLLDRARRVRAGGGGGGWGGVWLRTPAPSRLAFIEAASERDSCARCASIDSVFASE